MSRTDRVREGLKRTLESLDAAPGPTPEQEAEMRRDFELSVKDQTWSREHIRRCQTKLPLHWTEGKVPDMMKVMTAAGVPALDDGGLQGRFVHTRTGLNVIISGAYHGGKRWLHVSASHPTTTPTWAEMSEVKHVFIGDDRRAIMVAPAKQYHVNAHDHCLHWWACWDDDGLPEFSRGLGMV